MENISNDSHNGGTGHIKLLRTSIMCAAYLLLAGGLFWCGYAVGSSSVTVAVAQPDTAPQDAAPQDTPAAASASVRYEVIAENGRLCLYETKGLISTLIAGEKVSTEIFPSDDRKELEHGIEFDNLSDAQAAFEDFVS